MSGERMSWITSFVVVLGYLGRRAVLALPHEVVALPGTTDALSLRLFVTKSVGDAHFVAVRSSAKVPPATVTAELLVDASLNNEVFTSAMAKNGSFPVRASERSAYIIDGLDAGEAYDMFFVIEAENSNGLFSPVGRVLGVSTNALAPAISSLTVVPVDARTNATQLSLSMDAPGVPCRVWYTVLPLRDTVLLGVEEFSAKKIAQTAQPSKVIDLPQGLKGMRSPLPVDDGLESDTWYQVSAVSERAQGVFSEPVYAAAKTHRDPARVVDTTLSPVPGSTDSLAVMITLDCSSAPTNEACGIMSYQVTETPPSGSPENAKPRQVAQGTAMIVDGRPTPHVVAGLAPGKTHSVSMAIEAPGSNGAFGPTLEVDATTFPRAPKLVTVEAARADTEPSTVIVHYKLSEPGVIHVSLVEKVGHPQALIGTMIGNQHGVSFSREVGLSAGSEDDEEEDSALEGSQEIHDLAPGSAFEVTAQTEATIQRRQSSVFGEGQERLIEAVPPTLARVTASPPDATTTELLLEYEVLGTAGTLHYVLSEAEAAAQSGQDSLTNSAKTVKSAVEGQAGVLVAGSTLVSPGGKRSNDSKDSNALGAAESPPTEQLRFRGLEPSKRYIISLCTESNSGTLSQVTVAVAEAHAEAPLIAEVTTTPADRSAEALSLAVALETSGLVHFVVRRAAEGDNTVASRDHTIVYKGTREVNGTSSSSSPPQPQLPPGGGAAEVLETVEGLEPNATYEIFLVTETTNSNGVYRAEAEPFLVTTHPMPPLLLDARARAADASSSSFVVMVSLASLAEVHYAVFPVPTTETPTGDDGLSADHGEARGHGPDGGEDGGVRDSSDWGCGNHTANVGERREATALNDTVGLVVSGVIPSTTTAGLLHLAVAEKDSESVPGAAPSTLPGAGGKSSNTPASVRSLEGNALEVMFRVEGLQAAQAYSVCLFTETPGSNGLFGGVHELRPIFTHAPVPELASEGVACTVDCQALNRDPCWLEANKCGECYDGFDGKAGHVNSLCGKVASLTEDDMARIAERERQEAEEKQEERETDSGNVTPEITSGSGGPTSAILPDDPLVQPASRQSVAKNAKVSGSISSPPTSLTKSRLLMGVPFAEGPNVTKFLYIEVPKDRKEGSNAKDRSLGSSAFDVEEATARLCAEIHDGEEGQNFLQCLSSLKTTLSSRYSDGRFHLEDDPERPILQVEVDAPGGESLAFTLRHGEEDGIAVVDFCRENEKVFPDEQECVVALMQEIYS